MEFLSAYVNHLKRDDSLALADAPANGSDFARFRLANLVPILELLEQKIRYVLGCIR